MDEQIYNRLICLMEEGAISKEENKVKWNRIIDFMNENDVLPEELQEEIRQDKCDNCRNKCSYYCPFADFMNTDFED